MNLFLWGAGAGAWVAIVAYLCRAVVNDAARGSTPGDDEWRDFWRSDATTAEKWAEAAEHYRARWLKDDPK